MKILTKEQILVIHQRCIEETGGALGFRDEGLFDSALAQPYQSFSGSELYPTVEQKAARVRCKNHVISKQKFFSRAYL